jgi:hypothetical protein
MILLRDAKYLIFCKVLGKNLTTGTLLSLDP